MTGVSAETNTYLRYRLDWLARRVEPVLLPELPIIDAHHHLWDVPRPRYMWEDLQEDVGCGHNIRATVYVDCRSMYRADGPEPMRSIGEVEFANGVAAIGASGVYGGTKLCAAIVGHADLRQGEAALPVLEALVAAGNGRFKGIRQVTASDPDQMVLAAASWKPPGILSDDAFRRGFAQLVALDLTFDAFVYHHQLLEVRDLARAFPSGRVVLDHLGGPIHIGSYANKRKMVFDSWRSALKSVAECPNVFIKIGGLGMRLFGFDFDKNDEPPSSEALAEAWRPYVETVVETFGCERCMFESNFPPDKGSCSYPILWNAYKRLSQSLSPSERAALFFGNAARFYRLSDI